MPHRGQTGLRTIQQRAAARRRHTRPGGARHSLGGGAIRLSKMIPLGSTSKYFFKRSLYNEISTASGQLKDGVSWKLSDVPGYTEFTNLFDQYRINMVVVKFICRASSTSVMESYNNSAIALPILHWVIDLDDEGTPANISELEQYGKKHTYMFDAGKRVATCKIRPRNTNKVYGAASADAAALAKPGIWLDTASATVPYYGLKYILDIPQTGTVYNMTFDVVTTFYLQFRQSR